MVLDSVKSIHKDIKSGIDNIKDIDSFQIAARRLAFLIHEDAAPLAVSMLTKASLIEKGLVIAIEYLEGLQNNTIDIQE